LDEFKLVNDSLGREAGDQLLLAVGRRLEASLRSTDVCERLTAESSISPDEVAHTLARVGGDEFVILLDNVRNAVDASRIADRVQASLARPFQLAGRDVFIGASIGIVVSGGTAYTRTEEVLRDADTAMNRAKSLGKGRSEVFNSEMADWVVERLRLD